VLGRFQIIRGKRPPGNPLPAGRRFDVRKHTDHVLRPDAKSVQGLLEHVTASTFRRFAVEYRALLAARFKKDRAPFDELAALARETDVYIGCNCPTKKNPDVRRCHTVLALEFMKKKYPDLDVVLPE
jgi:hypothetical protein